MNGIGIIGELLNTAFRRAEIAAALVPASKRPVERIDLRLARFPVPAFDYPIRQPLGDRCFADSCLFTSSGLFCAAAQDLDNLLQFFASNWDRSFPQRQGRSDAG